MTLLLLPNQLFPLKMLPKDITTIYLIEEPRYFTDFKFHKLKLMYHRASMQKYMSKLKIKCIYKNFNEVNNKMYTLLNKETTTYFNPTDHKLESKYKKLLSKATMIDSINFLLTTKEIHDNKNIFYRNNKYSHDLFYKFQRQRLNILMKDNKPIGKWSYDDMNRQTIPHNITIPKTPIIRKDKYYKEAKHYVEKHFATNYGDTDTWDFPIDTLMAIKWLKHFMAKKLAQFGPYQDATILTTDSPYLFHSILSPMMNIGILPDRLVISIVETYKHKFTHIASYEGFIRQVIGWRNYVHSIYVLEPKMINMNALNHQRKIGNKYWNDIGILPIDSIIKKIIKYSYAHHIERLMFLSNWFLINQIHPKEVYRIFMEWTVDAYDWVMVPNVMGMGQYADGGMMTTRIYFSSSNYILKMSDIKKGEWCEIWDAIYYSFIAKHYKLLKHNYATSRQVAHWTKKTDKEKQHLLTLAHKHTN